MTVRDPWRKLWADLDRAKARLWDAEAEAYKEFLVAQRRAIEEYGMAVDPDGFDKHGQPIEAKVKLRASVKPTDPDQKVRPTG